MSIVGLIVYINPTYILRYYKMIEKIKVDTLSNAMRLRRMLMSEVDTYALKVESFLLNTTCMNINLIEQILINVPIHARDDKIGCKVYCSITPAGIDWIWPDGCGIDSEYIPTLDIMENQLINVEFSIVKGSPREHAKFALLNSIGIVESDEGCELIIEHQRPSLKMT